MSVFSSVDEDNSLAQPTPPRVGIATGDSTFVNLSHCASEKDKRSGQVLSQCESEGLGHIQCQQAWGEGWGLRTGYLFFSCLTRPA